MIRDWARWHGPTPAGGTTWSWILPWFFHGVVFDQVAAFGLAVLGAAVVVKIADTRATPGPTSLLRFVTIGAVAAALALLWPALLFVGIVLVTVALRLCRRPTFAGEVWVIAMGLTGVAFVLTSAPAFRFASAYVAVLFACALLPRGVAALRITGRRMTFATMLVLAGLLSALLAGAVEHVRQSQYPRGGRSTGLSAEQLWLPPAMPQPELIRDRVDGFDYVYPRFSNQCWSAPLPCATEKLEARLALRDPRRGIAGGFLRIGE